MKRKSDFRAQSEHNKNLLFSSYSMFAALVVVLAPMEMNSIENVFSWQSTPR